MKCQMGGHTVTLLTGSSDAGWRVQASSGLELRGSSWLQWCRCAGVSCRRVSECKGGMMVDNDDDVEH